MTLQQKSWTTVSTMPTIASLILQLLLLLSKLDGQYNLELFHGSTIAFKDMALSILPYFMTTAAKKHGLENKIVILTATSGDTGKAAMAGFADVPGTEIIVFLSKRRCQQGARIANDHSDW